MVEFIQRLVDAVDDRSVAAVAIEAELQPVSGPSDAVACPTYPPPTRGSSPAHPYSPEAFVPEPGEDGWLTGLARDTAGRPVVAPSVVLDSVGSQSNRAENALWENRAAFGGLPGLTVSGPPSGDGDVGELLSNVFVSSWTASHRHVDAWIRLAAEGGNGGEPLWKSDNANGVKRLISGINSTRDATTAFQYAPNALLYGFWLSSNVIERHRQARVYSSEIVGFGARDQVSGATRVDDLPASKDAKVDPKEFGIAAKTAAPSTLGFGSVPAAMTHTYVCERIVARASISLAALRNIRFADDPAGEKNRAAAVALAVLGLAGDALSRQQTMLRSGCDLVPVETRHGLRVAGRVTPRPLDLGEDSGSVEFWSTCLREALVRAKSAGLEFAEPIDLSLSAPQVKLVTDSAKVQMTKGEDD